MCVSHRVRYGDKPPRLQGEITASNKVQSREGVSDLRGG